MLGDEGEFRSSNGLHHAIRLFSPRQREQQFLAGDRWREFDVVLASTVGMLLNASNVTHQFQQALAAVGPRRVRFHDLRHSAVSFLIESGVDMRHVQDQFGHSGQAYTIGIYAHITSAMKQRAADAMNALEPTADLYLPIEDRDRVKISSARTGVTGAGRGPTRLDPGEKAA